MIFLWHASHREKLKLRNITLSHLQMLLLLFMLLHLVSISTTLESQKHSVLTSKNKHMLKKNYSVKTEKIQSRMRLDIWDCWEQKTVKDICRVLNDIWYFFHLINFQIWEQNKNISCTLLVDGIGKNYKVISVKDHFFNPSQFVSVADHVEEKNHGCLFQGCIIW